MGGEGGKSPELAIQTELRTLPLGANVKNRRWFRRNQRRLSQPRFPGEFVVNYEAKLSPQAVS